MVSAVTGEGGYTLGPLDLGVRSGSEIRIDNAFGFFY